MPLIPNPRGPNESALAQRKRQERERAIRKLDELLRLREMLYKRRQRSKSAGDIEMLSMEISAISVQLPTFREHLNGVQLSQFSPAIMRYLKI